MNALTVRLKSLTIAPADRPVYALVAAWTLAMITLPILLWTFGEGALPGGVLLSVVLLVTAGGWVLVRAWDVRRALGTMAAVVVLAWGVEWLGSTSGFPFGTYHYTARLQPQLFNVPLLVPLAWLMMLPSAWGIAGLIVGTLHTPQRRAAFVAVSALAFTAWDLFLDPQMVNWGFWLWSNPGDLNYFGIPIVNYAGWLFASMVMTAVVRPPELPRGALPPLLLIYGVTIFLQTIGVGIFWGMPGPAVCGLVGMGVMLALAVRRYRQSKAAGK